MLEFRWRSIWWGLSFIITLMCCLNSVHSLLFLMIEPLYWWQNSVFFMTVNLHEMFSTCVTTSLCFSLVLCFPLALYHWWCFFAPSWTLHIRNRIARKLFLSILWLLCSMVISWYWLLPLWWDWLLCWHPSEKSLLSVHFRASIGTLTNNIGKWYACCALLSQLPFCLYWYIGRMEISTRCRSRKLLFILSLLLSALVTPPDLLVQLCIACLLFLMCEVTLVWSVYLQVLQKKISICN